MMIVSIMQPYFFPYISYFQLMAASDLFVVRDDVQYVQGGWVNRNRILVNGEARWITLPVAKAHHHLPINRRDYLLDGRQAQRLRRRIVGAYRGAPYFDRTVALVEEVLSCPDSNVASFNTNLLRCIAEKLAIATPFQLSSALEHPPSPVGQERVIDLCVRLGASDYVNPIGGLDLYDASAFAERNLTLRFLQSSVSSYRQFGAPHIESLSIIDAMMFNSLESIAEMLAAYRLISGRTDPMFSGGSEAGAR